MRPIAEYALLRTGQLYHRSRARAFDSTVSQSSVERSCLSLVSRIALIIYDYMIVSVVKM